MNIKFTDQFKKECSVKFGIRPSHITDAITNKDHIESINLDGEKQLVFFSKEVIFPKQQFYLVVCTQKVADVLEVDLAFKIPTDLCINHDEVTPLSLLQILANKFGLNITIGNTTSKFILRKQIPCDIKEPSRIVTVCNQSNHDFIQSFFIKICNNEIPYVDCAICFCIDLNLYIEGLRNSGISLGRF